MKGIIIWSIWNNAVCVCYSQHLHLLLTVCICLWQMGFVVFEVSVLSKEMEGQLMLCPNDLPVGSKEPLEWHCPDQFTETMPHTGN